MVSDNPAEFVKTKEFLVGIDSDGCAFDSMEIKHKECFIPNTINFFDLQSVSKYAREAAEFVNLYSKWRGINRFPALLNTVDLLLERPEVQRRGVKIAKLESVRDWCKRESKQANPALEKEVARTQDPDLTRTLAWSKAVNTTIDGMVHGVPPFPFVRESLDKLAAKADMMVCSATPTAALRKEWEEHGIAGHVSNIYGQEAGTKKEILQHTGQKGYDKSKILMIGDAPGDMQAAKANSVLFYPINPGAEEASWERFLKEACDRFFAGTYAGEYEAKLIAEFDAYLPELPPWKK
jgi:phosphoglycolate phosphatase-like HAD superfamily hydrolase